jgi:hypothetical protein
MKHDAHQYPNDIDDAMDAIECGLTLLVGGLGALLHTGGLCVGWGGVGGCG